MTKTYALKRLLEHGQMTRPEIVDCTGWTTSQVDRALQHLHQHKLIRRRQKPIGRGGGYAFEAVMP